MAGNSVRAPLRVFTAVVILATSATTFLDVDASAKAKRDASTKSFVTNVILGRDSEVYRMR